MSAETGTAAHRQQMVSEIRRLEQASARPSEPLDLRVLDVMSRVPREAFVRHANAGEAYINAPLAIGFGQTISQPFIVALMTSLARIAPNHRVLEIGTGSGYQTAILAALTGHVFSIERVAGLSVKAAEALRAQGIRNATLDIRDGHAGWPEHAPYDAIVVTAAPAEVPPALIDQLAPQGRLVIPVGRDEQMLTLIERRADGEVTRKEILPVRFVPLVR
ncbi:MAG: protein-L-isoaspartate(D-aspartate) O-methyltransferase [Hyphomicrobiaceae bacterium]|nr:protein-L-isoaspartate(D-aspartate) O-methyltransferase [Hyphomicrobiaceae bacterium]